MNIEHFQNYPFLKVQTNQVKTCKFFLFHDLPACNKKADISPSTTTLMAHLRSQFNYVFLRR